MDRWKRTARKKLRQGESQKGEDEMEKIREGDSQKREDAGAREKVGKLRNTLFLNWVWLWRVEK